MNGRDSPDRSSILVTGATGYIGGRLVGRLLARGYRVRCLVRDRRKVGVRAWSGAQGLEIVEGDAGDERALAEAMAGCSAAYYLIHSMMAVGAEYRDRDRTLARGFARAAEAAGVERIVYLGGLGEEGEDLSDHLTSRRETEAALKSGSVPVTVLRAAMIIGSGSASFEILRYLVERLPMMITPRWVQTESQPIAVANVLHYLAECLEVPETAGRTLDIGGADVMSYREIMQIMAEARGLRRRVIVPVPVLTPRLSSLWIHLVTPVSARIARPLAEGLRNRVVCRDGRAAELMPQRLYGVRESIERALAAEQRAGLESTWADAGPMPGDPEFAGGTEMVDRKQIRIAADPEAVFDAVCRIGGGHGYYAADWLWRIRGWMDRLVGGPGLRRERRDPRTLGYGDRIDFWRVIEADRGRRLRLRAEMKLPGVALLEFDIEPDGEHSTLIQTARFKPKGLPGLMYWYAVLPFHGIVFKGMLEGIRRAAENPAAS